MATTGREARLMMLTVPGLGSILAEQAKRAGLRPSRVEYDGRNEIVSAMTGVSDRLVLPRTAERVLVDAGTIPIRGTTRGTAAVLQAEGLVSASRTWMAFTGSPRIRSFRVVARLRREPGFHRTALRDAMAERISRLTKWRALSPEFKGLEVWVMETRPGELRIGLRLPDLGTRAAPGRTAERHGSLPVAVAAGMVHLAGPPDGVLLDPCCGSGTILTEATTAGWAGLGADDSSDALLSARANGAGRLTQADVRRLPYAADGVSVVVTNLPFGAQHSLDGLPVAWYRRTLRELTRVAPSAVVLAPASPPFRQALGRLRVDLIRRADVRILGRPATIWVLRRPTSGPAAP